MPLPVQKAIFLFSKWRDYRSLSGVGDHVNRRYLKQNMQLKMNEAVATNVRNSFHLDIKGVDPRQAQLL